MAVKQKSQLKLTAPERQALLHADPATGRITASSSTLRLDLRVKGYAKSTNEGRGLVLTEYGWRLRARLQEEHKPYSVAGVPWSKVEEITDLYLLHGLSFDEISGRTRVKGEDVRAVLAFRQVIPAV
jgi:hypothetical protein